jgi:pSer/pThr/pTyr-binding forkhead associated (FHA) protein
MGYIRIFDEIASEEREFECDEVRFGRDPASEFVPTGESRKVVSANHARAFFSESSWFIEDLGSRNGTYLDGTRLPSGEPVKLSRGAKLRLGTTGPSFRIVAVAELRVSQTIDEPVPAVSPNAATAPMEPIDIPGPADEAAELREPHIVLLHEASGTRYEANGTQFRLGRGRECEMRPVGPGDTSISRVHAQIEVRNDGSVIVRDAGSRNGTLVNGKLIEDESPFVLGDRLGLGAAGPVLFFAEIDGVTIAAPISAPTPEPKTPVSEKAPSPQPTLRSPRRSFGGKGATVFFKDMFEESTRKSKSRLRWLVWTFVVLLVGSVGGVFWVSEMRVRGTEAQIEEQARLLEAQQARADSLRLSARAEVDRLGDELDRARAGAAPAAVLDSLRQALADAGARTDALEEALVTAQQSLSRELAMGDSLRRQAQADLARVRAELGRAQGGGTDISQHGQSARCSSSSGRAGRRD